MKESVQKLADQKFAYAQIELYEESYTLNEQKALLAFQQLDDKCQELVELRYIKNLGHEEISQRVSGIKNREVSRTLVSRCLKKLEHIIKKTKH